MKPWFFGKSNGTVYRYGLDEISVKDSSGMDEIGVSFRPAQKNAGWSFKANIQGYFSQRDGVAGRFIMNYT